MPDRLAENPYSAPTACDPPLVSSADPVLQRGLEWHLAALVTGFAMLAVRGLFMTAPGNAANATQQNFLVALTTLLPMTATVVACVCFVKANGPARRVAVFGLTLSAAGLITNCIVPILFTLNFRLGQVSVLSVPIFKLWMAFVLTVLPARRIVISWFLVKQATQAGSHTTANFGKQLIAAILCMALMNVPTLLNLFGGNFGVSSFQSSFAYSAFVVVSLGELGVTYSFWRFLRNKRSSAAN